MFNPNSLLNSGGSNEGQKIHKYGGPKQSTHASPQRQRQPHQQSEDISKPAKGSSNHQNFHVGQLSALGTAFGDMRSLKTSDKLMNPEPTSFWQLQLHQAGESRKGMNLPHRHCKRGDAVQMTNKGTEVEEASEETKSRSRLLEGQYERDWDALDFSGQGLRNVSQVVFKQFIFLRSLFLDHNNLGFIDPAISQLSLLAELDISSNRIEVIPAEIGMLLHLKQLLMFDNHIDNLPMELGHLFRLESLGIDGNPLSSYFKDIISQSGTEGLIKNLRDEHLSPPEPQSRPWIYLEESESPPDVSIISYNILCEKYATATQYGYTPARALAWENRREHIIEEIISRDADILCLQEIDRGAFQDSFQPRLSVLGYKGLFYPRSRAKNMNEREALSVDGCAILFKSPMFNCLDKMLIDLATTAINRPDMKSENDIFNRVMPRDNIALVAFLEHSASSRKIIVANAHIFWDPAFADVKLVQVAILLEEISRKSFEWGADPSSRKAQSSSSKHKETGNTTRNAASVIPPSSSGTSSTQLPLIICGDFNSAVGTGVYDLITNGELPGDHEDFNSRAYGKFTRDGMRHPFKLSSAYAHIGELNFTNYTPNFAGVLDYIWYSPDFMKVTGLLGDLDERDLRRIPGFPHLHFPSDHLILHATFNFKPNA